MKCFSEINSAREAVGLKHFKSAKKSGDKLPATYSGGVIWPPVCEHLLEVGLSIYLYI